MEKYDLIGKTYNSTRKADIRITKTIIKELKTNIPSTIIDVGAGTGNYSMELSVHGFDVLAVEPSRVMREQGKKHKNLRWLSGVAEQLPFEDNSMDGAVCLLATHHFSDLEKSLKEMIRVVKKNGTVLIFTADPRLCPNNFWLRDYFSNIIEESYNIYPQINDFKDLFEEVSGNTVDVIKFPIPHDIIDQFFFSGWRHPELYLDSTFRAGISSLSNLPKELLEPSLSKLKEDLNSGLWYNKNSSILELTEYDGGYRFLKTRK